MADAEDIQAAVAAGVLDAQQGERLRAFLAARSVAPAEAPDPDDERFRLIGGFNDVFVTIGIALVFGALAVFLLNPYAITYGCAALAWVLAEIFTRRYRMALPSIALAGLFAFNCLGIGALWALGSANFDWNVVGYSFQWVGAFAAAAMVAHYVRFRVPIDVAIATALALGVLVSAVHVAAPQWLSDHSGAIALAAGLATFGFALVFDLADPKRITHRSDVAFWLHMLAAPLIAHGLFAGIIGASRLGGEDAGLVIAVTLTFTLVALVIDRRALIVSALAYAGGAFYYLLKTFGPATNATALSVLLLGATVLVLSVGWRWLRGLIVPRLPLQALVARLPPVHAA